MSRVSMRKRCGLSWSDEGSLLPLIAASLLLGLFGAIHAVLTLQKKYGYAGAFRIKGYLEQDYHRLCCKK
jgi:hypothetical protein